MRFDFTGLETGPSQVWGGIRVVPLLRPEPITDLRLSRQLYDEDLTIVEVSARSFYASYVPHAFIAAWTPDGSPAASFGTQLRKGATITGPPVARLAVEHRMAKRVDVNRLRFLPSHLAIEGYLSLHFGGPAIAWEHWSAQAIRSGLSPRAEESYSGQWVNGLAEALRHFEILPGQCGVALYAADALASVFVVPHPADYRTLHPSLVQDMYGELVYRHAAMPYSVPEFEVEIDQTRIRDLADLRREAERQTEVWGQFHDHTMAAELFDETEYTGTSVYTMGDFTLSRFLPSFAHYDTSHIGEMITDGAGRVAYFKSFRLSNTQARRGRLLSMLHAADWELPRAALEAGIAEAELAARLDRVGFGALIRKDFMDGYRAQQRIGRKRRGKGPAAESV